MIYLAATLPFFIIAGLGSIPYFLTIRRIRRENKAFHANLERQRAARIAAFDAHCDRFLAKWGHGGSGYGAGPPADT